MIYTVNVNELVNNHVSEEIVRLITNANDYVLQCYKGGLTRLETESNIRAEILKTFETSKKFENFETQIEERLSEQSGRNVEYSFAYDVNNALEKHYGQRTKNVDQLVKFLESDATTFGREARKNRDIFSNHLSPKNFGPLTWFNKNVNIKIPRCNVKDVTSICFASISEIFDAWDLDAFQITRIRRVRTRDAASNGGVGFPVCMSISKGWGGRILGFTSNEFYLGSSTGESKSWCVKPNERFSEFDEEIDHAASFSNVMSKLWYADISMNGPTVRIIIGPSEAKDLFALREIQNEHKRKTALIHIVRNHERRKNILENEIIKVRSHLRGKTTCSWKDCSVMIHAPPAGEEKEYYT